MRKLIISMLILLGFIPSVYANTKMHVIKNNDNESVYFIANEIKQEDLTKFHGNIPTGYPLGEIIIISNVNIKNITIYDDSIFNNGEGYLTFTNGNIEIPANLNILRDLGSEQYGGFYISNTDFIGQLTDNKIKTVMLDVLAGDNGINSPNNLGYFFDNNNLTVDINR